MIIVLLTLLAISLTLIIIGASLSSQKVSHARRVPDIYGEERYVPLKKRASQQLTLRGNSYRFERRERGKALALVNMGPVFFSRGGKRTSWLGITLILISLFGFGVYSLQVLLPHSALLALTTWSNSAASPPTSSAPNSSSTGKNTLPGSSGASRALVRLGQLDPAQYASSQEYNTWAYSACSPAALAEIFNAYGRHYRVTDVLNVEAKIGEITPALGLVEPVGIDRTAAQFGFKAIWLRNLSLDELITYANRGTPVIIGFPPDRWSGGHILITRGGNATTVYLADTSRLNMQSMPRQTFLKYWVGFAVAVVPK